MLQPAAARKKVSRSSSGVARDVPDALHGDVDHLRQIIVNLVSNAIKFTEVGSVLGARRARDAVDEESSALLHFSVRDTGIGIPLDAQARIFGRSSRPMPATAAASAAPASARRSQNR